MITLRDATPKDAASIVQLIGELAISIGERSTLSTTYVEKYLLFPGCKALLAEVDGQIVGLLSYTIHPNLYHAGETCLIEEFVVRESARGQGVGSALLNELLHRMEALGCVEVSVSTMPDNAEAIRFYKEHGMFDEAILLEKHLSGEGSGKR
jgi:ribosomal protein S18 acetylase RimI-like enzyme